MRRSSVPNDEIIKNSGCNIDELINKFDTKSDKHRLQQLFSTPIPKLQRDLDMYYDRDQSRDITAEAMQRELLRRLILKQNTDSLLSLTDSEFCSDDQSRIDGGDVVVGRRDFRYRNVENDDVDMGKEKVAYSLSRVSRILDMLSRLPWPRMSFTALGICFLGAIFISPRACVQNILFPAFRLGFGTLYPAYASYKAVRTKNVKEYVKWMMYWIVYAFFTCIETFTDIFLSWFPFYYEVKVLVVLWLLSPATKGSSVLYRKFVHPMLTRREQEIDDYLNQAKERGYTAVIQLGSKGVNYATNVIMQTALKGGGNLVQTIRRSYSLSDLSEPDVHRTQDEIDEITRPQQQSRILRQRHPNPVTRSSSGSRHSTGMYFSEIDVAPKAPIDNSNYNIRSSEDISSGYSSAEPVSGGLSRTSSMTSANKLRFRAKRAEDDNFSENDENEYLKQKFLSAQYPQRFYDPNNPLTQSPAYPIQSISSDSPKLHRPIPRLLSKDVSDDWIDEGLVENEINVPPEMKEKYEMFCQWLQNSNNIKNENPQLKTYIKKQFSDDDFKDAISVNSEEELDKFIDFDSSNDKFEMKIEVKQNIRDKVEEPIGIDQLNKLNTFEENKEIESEKKNDELEDKITIQNVITEINTTHDILVNPELKPLKCELSSENLQKTEKQVTNDESENKNLFLDTKGITIENTEFKPFKIEPFAKVIVQNDSIDNLSDNNQEIKKSEIISPRKEHDYEEISFSSSSLSEHKRPVYHSKGKAPVPPNPDVPPKLSYIQPITHPKTPLPRPKSPFLNFPSPSPTATNFHDETDVAKSRSPSPKPETTTKKSTKRSLFRNYLPSIFRSESPKTIQIKSDDDSHRETEI